MVSREDFTPERLAELKIRSCDNKVRYPTERVARDSAKRYRKRWGSRMSVYHCNLFCKGWHIGHDRKKFLQQKAEALQFLRLHLALFVIMSLPSEEADPGPETAKAIDEADSPGWEEDLTMDSFSETIS